jgi:hypothetical protein
MGAGGWGTLSNYEIVEVSMTAGYGFMRGDGMKQKRDRRDLSCDLLQERFV